MIIRFLAPFILGIGFALGWSPCVGPILTSIMLLSSTNLNSGLWLMIIYALGLALPFLLTALAIERCFAVFNKLKKYARVIEILSGILLVAIGFIVFVGGMDKFNIWLS